MIEMMKTKQMKMSETNFTHGGAKWLDELSALAQSEKLKKGNLKSLKWVYCRINLAYISLCEENANLPYMPSSKCDMLIHRYSRSSELEKVRETVEQRLRDINKYIERV